MRDQKPLTSSHIARRDLLSVLSTCSNVCKSRSSVCWHFIHHTNFPECNGKALMSAVGCHSPEGGKSQYPSQRKPQNSFLPSRPNTLHTLTTLKSQWANDVIACNMDTPWHVHVQLHLAQHQAIINSSAFTIYSSHYSVSEGIKQYNNHGTYNMQPQISIPLSFL